jgi:integrase
MYAVLYPPNFAVQAAAHKRPELRKLPFVLLDGEAPAETVFAVSKAAHLLGVEVGMTRLQAESFPEVVTVPRILEDEDSAHSTLHTIACMFSPRIESVEAHPGTYALDIQGMNTLYGDAAQLASMLRQRIKAAGFFANVAVAQNSEAVVRQCFNNIRAITKLAKKQKYLSEDPGEDTKMPQTKSAEKPVMLREQILSLIEAITDLHDLCLLYIGIFCGPRSSEVFGFQWASWNGESLLPLGTAYEGQLYEGRTKTKQSKAPIHVPDQVRLVIEAWRRICPDASPKALMFPTFGRGKRKGQAVPRWGKNFLKWRIRPVAQKLGIPNRLVTFQVMRRTLGTDMQHHGTLKDTQGILRHASIRTTGDIYVQPIDASVQQAVNSRTTAVLEGFIAPVATMGQQGRNVKRPEAIRRSSAKLLEEVSVSS